MKRLVFSLTILAGLATLVMAQDPLGRARYFTPSAEPADPMMREQQLGVESAQLAHQLADETDSEKREDLRKKLSGVLELQFDASQKRRESEIAAIEKQLAKLKGTLKKRADARREIVERRLEQLTREADGLGWSVSEGDSNLFLEAAAEYRNHLLGPLSGFPAAVEPSNNTLESPATERHATGEPVAPAGSR